MDATSRRICLTGVLKMNSFRDSFLFSSFSSPYFLLFGHGCRLLFPRLRRNETTEWTDRYGACKRYRSTLPIPMRKREEIFLNVQRPRSFVSVSRFPPPPLLFPSLFPSTRGEGRRTSGAEVETAARKNGASRRKLLLAPFNFKVNRGRPTYLP